MGPHGGGAGVRWWNRGGPGRHGGGSGPTWKRGPCRLFTRTCRWLAHSFSSGRAGPSRERDLGQPPRFGLCGCCVPAFIPFLFASRADPVGPVHRSCEAMVLMQQALPFLPAVPILPSANGSPCCRAGKTRSGPHGTSGSTGYGPRAPSEMPQNDARGTRHEAWQCRRERHHKSAALFPGFGRCGRGGDCVLTLAPGVQACGPGSSPDSTF